MILKISIKSFQLSRFSVIAGHKPDDVQEIKKNHNEIKRNKITSRNYKIEQKGKKYSTKCRRTSHKQRKSPA